MEDSYFNSEDREHLEMMVDLFIIFFLSRISPNFSFSLKKEKLGLACVLLYGLGKAVVINL
jgi:hypothetical protein